MFIYKANVRRVVDGDTIDVSLDLGFGIHADKRVRLIGIDTPETRTRNLQEKAWGLKAKAFVQTAVGAAAEIVIRTELHDGKFGRTLGTIICDGVDLNQLLIQNRLAVPYSMRKDTWIAKLAFLEGVIT